MFLELYYHNLRDYSRNKQKSVDDYQYGGDAGMVLTIQPIDDCISMIEPLAGFDLWRNEKLKGQTGIAGSNLGDGEFYQANPGGGFEWDAPTQAGAGNAAYRLLTD